MSAFMVGGHIEIVIAQHQWAFSAEKNFIERLFKAALSDAVQIAACCQQSGLVDQVCQIGSDHTGCGASDCNQIDIVGEGHVARMNF